MLISKKNGSGNRIPATGIHVNPKQSRKYANWNIVKQFITLKGTDSTNGACSPSRTLSTEDQLYNNIILLMKEVKMRKKN